MITKENCKKLENGKVIMDFAVFQELTNAKTLIPQHYNLTLFISS